MRWVRSEARERRESMAHDRLRSRRRDERRARTARFVVACFEIFAAARRRETVMCARTRLRMRGTRALVTCLKIERRRLLASRRDERSDAFRRTRESAEACAKTRVDAATQTHVYRTEEEVTWIRLWKTRLCASKVSFDKQ